MTLYDLLMADEQRGGNATADLIELLSRQDDEAKAIAEGLMVKSMGSGAINPDAPAWHPSNPSHPLHDAWQDFGHEMYTHPDSDLRGLHPLADREAATRRARQAINDFAHPLVAQHLHDRLSGNQAIGGVPSIDPLHPASPLHDYYLANPAYYHDIANHDVGRNGTESQISTELHYAARKPSHPLHPDNPDRQHFLEAHARGVPLWHPTSPYFAMHGTDRAKN